MPDARAALPPTREALAVALLLEVALELRDEQPPVGQDQDAKRPGCVDEARGGDRLARGRRVPEPVAADGAGGGPPGRKLLEHVLFGGLVGLLVLLVLGDVLEGRAVAVQRTLVLLQVGDELGEHPGERIDLVAPELGAGGEPRRPLAEDALEPEHEAVAHLPARRGLGQPGLDLGQRVVERAPARGAGREDLFRILVGVEEGLACPCICAAHAGAATFSEIPLAQSPQGERGRPQYTPPRVRAVCRLLPGRRRRRTGSGARSPRRRRSSARPRRGAASRAPPRRRACPSRRRRTGTGARRRSPRLRAGRPGPRPWRGTRTRPGPPRARSPPRAAPRRVSAPAARRPIAPRRGASARRGRRWRRGPPPRARSRRSPAPARPPAATTRRRRARPRRARRRGAVPRAPRRARRPWSRDQGARAARARAPPRGRRGSGSRRGPRPANLSGRQRARRPASSRRAARRFRSGRGAS